MRNIFIAVILFLILSCRKNENETLPHSFNETEFQVKNITQNSALIQYKIKPTGLKGTGIIYSKKPADSTSNLTALAKTSAGYVASDSCYILTLNNLESYTNYWVRIYFMDYLDSVTYSKVYTVSTLGFNIRWRDGFSKMVVRGQNINFIGENIDTVRNNYQIFYDGSSWPLINIIRNSNQIYEFDTNTPVSSPIGKHKFIVYYKAKVIFNDDLEILYSPLFKQITKHPVGYGPSNAFLYNNEVYLYFAPNGYASFWKWNPQTSFWTELPAPNIVPNLPEASQGYELNGKIYFPPFTCATINSVLCYRSSDDEKYIYSYDPDLGIWEKNALVHNDSIPEYSGLYSSFILNNKLYCIVIHNTGESDGKSMCLLKAFDPYDFSWRTIIDSVPFPDARGYKTAVVNDKIFVLTSSIRKSDYATTYYKNELYCLDLETKIFTKKSMWDYIDVNSLAYEVGSINPYFFEYNKHLYFYAGESGIGYFHILETKCLEYNIETDSWTPFYKSLTFSARYGGFECLIDGKIYICMGADVISGLGCYIYELSFN